mgnify:CR=1 FL=1
MLPKEVMLKAQHEFLNLNEANKGKLIEEISAISGDDSTEHTFALEDNINGTNEENKRNFIKSIKNSMFNNVFENKTV